MGPCVRRDDTESVEAARYILNNACRSILPVPVFGNSSMKRTSRVQMLSRAIGEHIYHPAGEHARIRNAIMAAKSQEDHCRDLAWLYGGTGLAG